MSSTANVVANIYPAEATNTNVSWRSTNEQVAKVQGSGIVGKVQAVDVGVCEIIATTEDGNYTATCYVNVLAEKPAEPTPETEPEPEVPENPDQVLPPITDTENNTDKESGSVILKKGKKK